MNELKYNDWGDFFQKTPFTFFKTALIQKKYIEIINKYTQINGRLLEIAGGSGYTSAVVADLVRVKNAVVDYSDLNQSLVQNARYNFSSIENLSFRCLDAFDLGMFPDNYYDAIFHQGFLEHFNDEKIIKFLEQQRRITKFIIFDVPNNRRWKKEQEFGNERFLGHKYWIELAKAANLQIIEDTGRRFTNKWKKFVPEIIMNTDFFHRHFGESSIIVCVK